MSGSPIDSARVVSWCRWVLPPDLVDLVEAPLAHRLSPTPIERSDALECWLKRDDLGAIPTHKSRGLAIEVARAAAQGAKGVVMSSSGNAALAMGAWCRELGVRGLAFLSEKTSEAKIEAVVETGVATAVTAKPKNFSSYAARYGGLVDLRPSRREEGSVGYRLLAAELDHQLGGRATAVFFFVNSGLTLLGVHEGLVALMRLGKIDRLPSLNAVQCTASPDLADVIGSTVRLQQEPAAGALGAQVPTSLAQTASAIRSTGGAVWMVQNDEIEDERRRLKGLGLDVAVESVAALAGFRRARAQASLGDDPVVVIAAPARRCSTTREDVLARVDRPESYTDVRALLDGLGLGRANV